MYSPKIWLITLQEYETTEDGDWERKHGSTALQQLGRQLVRAGSAVTIEIIQDFPRVALPDGKETSLL